MPIRVPAKPIYVTIDPLNLMAGLEILNGNPVQSFNRDLNEYTDDRTLVPLLLMPWVSIIDNQKVMPSGRVAITGVQYYEGSPATGTQIISGSDYIISDTNAPAYSLKVKKNIPADSPIEIYAIFTFTDTRTNKAVTVEKSISLYTTYYEASNYSIRLNQPAGFTIDPTRAIRDENDNMPVEITAQMFSGKEAIADTNAAYFWYVLENENYRLLTDDDYYLMTPKGSGRYGKTIKVNAAYFDNLTLKVRAAYYSTGQPAPAEPVINSIQAVTTIKVKLPPTTIGKVLIHKGSYIIPDKDQEVERECIIEDNRKAIPNPEKYYSAVWYARAMETGAAEKQIGNGMTLKTTSKAIGVTNTLSYDVYPEVYEKECYKKSTDKAGNIFTDKNGNTLLIQSLK